MKMVVTILILGMLACKPESTLNRPNPLAALESKMVCLYLPDSIVQMEKLREKETNAIAMLENCHECRLVLDSVPKGYECIIAIPAQRRFNTLDKDSVIRYYKQW